MVWGEQRLTKQIFIFLKANHATWRDKTAQRDSFIMIPADMVRDLKESWRTSYLSHSKVAGRGSSASKKYKSVSFKHDLESADFSGSRCVFYLPTGFATGTVLPTAKQQERQQQQEEEEEWQQPKKSGTWTVWQANVKSWPRYRCNNLTKQSLWKCAFDMGPVRAVLMSLHLFQCFISPGFKTF